jgi:molybdopterin-guanine dinucleotide biosynthesis protein A
MPFLSPALVDKLMRSTAPEDVLAARGSGGFWEPFCARYRVASVAPVLADALAAQEFSFRALFARLSLAELTLSDSERNQLRDWDTEADVQEDMKHES